MNLAADLHTHSSVSDGVLTPAALVVHCAAQGVQRFALTDHDSLAGCDAAENASREHGVAFVRGVEVSCTWRGQSIHVIGLAPRIDAAALDAHLAAIRQQRRERLFEIGERLTRRGRLAGRDLAERAVATSDVPTRLHLARGLVAAGVATDLAHAFRDWLAHGKPGYVPVVWPDLEHTLTALQNAGAITVLAHAHRYRLSGGALRQLVGEFAERRGDALEVSICGMARNDLDRLATLARDRRLAASAGSDFHDPQVPWIRPGRFAKLPADLEPVTARLAA
jgi:3',5'-nucleoside bisphosphate phosphatase